MCWIRPGCFHLRRLILFSFFDCVRLATDDANDAGGAQDGKDKEIRQGGGWGSFFAGAGQAGRSGGISPTRSSEVKKAIRAAMAFGLPKKGRGGAGRVSEGGPSAGKDDGLGIEDDLSGGVTGTHVRATTLFISKPSVRIAGFAV